MRKIGKFFLGFLCIYMIIALGWNVLHYNHIRQAVAPLSTKWYNYNSAKLVTDELIYPELLGLIHKNDNIWVSMFLWPYSKDDNSGSKLQKFDLSFANYLRSQHTTGNIFVDSINFDYKLTPEKIKHSHVVEATGDNIHWHVDWQPNALPNNLFMWLFHTPLLQTAIYHSKLTTLEQIYAVLKISSNHQKVLVTNNGEVAYTGSRNFNRVNWNHEDMAVIFKGDFAKVLYQEAAKTIAELNPDTAYLVAASESIAANLSATNIDLSQYTKTKAARALKVAEIKPAILYLINHSTKIEAEIAILSDSDIIDAFNNFIKRGGELRLILDPNHWIFAFKFPNMPNVIPITNLLPNAQVGIFQTEFQMHTKSALFYLSNGNTVLLGGSANWTDGALDHFAYNDLNFLVLNDPGLNQSFLDMMDKAWQHSIPREKFEITHETLKIWISKLMLITGVNPW